MATSQKANHSIAELPYSSTVASKMGNTGSFNPIQSII